MRAHVLLALLLMACTDEATDKETETVTETVEVEVEVEADGPPAVATIPTVNGWVGAETSLQLGAYVSDDGAPAVDLTYTLDGGSGTFDGSRWTHTFDVAGTETVSFTVSDAAGQAASGSFEVVVGEPVAPVERPDPIDGATGVPVEVVLAWSGGGGADSFDVYLGSDPLAVAEADIGSDLFMGTVSGTEWDAGRLDADQDFYWRVDARLGDDAQRGSLWTFQTAPANLEPVFWGVQGAAFLGSDAVQLTWQAGQDTETPASDLTYAVYAGAPAVDWSAPILYTSDLSVVLTAADLPDLAPGNTVSFAVRCADELGDDDGNTAPLTVTLPESTTPLVFVDQTAASGGDGSLATPYAELGTALADVGASGGILALAAGDWTGSWTLDATTGVHVFGGFPELATLPSGASDADLLAARDPWTQRTVFTDPSGPQSAPSLAITGDVTLGGVHFSNFSGTALTGIDAQLALWDVSFASTEALRDAEDADFNYENDVIAVILQSDEAGSPLALEAVGVTTEWLNDGFRLNGVVSEVTLRNSSFTEHRTDVLRTYEEIVDFEGNTTDDTDLAVPDGGAFTLTVDNSAFFRVDAVTSEVTITPETEGGGGDLSLLVHDIDALALHSGNAFNIDDAGAAGGDILVDFRDNVLWGISSDCLGFRVSDERGQVSGDVSITIEDNVCRHGNGDGFDIGDISVAEGGTTTIAMHRNELGHLESTGHRFHFWSTHDEINPQPDGFIDISVTEGWCLNCDDGVYVGSGRGTDTRITVFNNFLEVLYESVEVRTGSNGYSRANVATYVGFNTNVGSYEGTASRLAVHNDAVFAFRNNASGFNDVDSSDALNVSGEGPGAGRVDVRNNVLARGGGDGLDAQGVFPTIVNNTIAFSGRESSSAEGVQGSAYDEYAQVVVENSIVFDSSGQDLEQGVSALWSIVGDHTSDQGAYLIQADPLFSEVGDELDFDSFYRPSAISPALYAGNPDAVYNDIDGTPNDIGAFGGPGGSMVGWFGAGATLPLEVIGIRDATTLGQGAELPSGGGSVTLALTRSIDTDTGLSVTADGAAVAGTWTFGDRTATFTPSTDWPAAATIVVSADDAVESTDGVANRFAWWDTFVTAPAVASVETTDANDDFGSAQALTDPVWDVTGSLSDVDTADFYAFSAAVGDRLTLASFSARDFDVGNLLYEVQDSSGAVVHRGNRYSFFEPVAFYGEEGDNENEDSGDTFLDHVFAANGDYALVIYDIDASSGSEPVIGEGETRDYRFQAWLR